MALPYVELPASPIAGIQPYGLLMLLAIFAGAMTAWRLARRAAISDSDAGLLLAIAIPSAFVMSHLFDVVAYELDRAAEDPGLWMRLTDGHALFGAVLAVAVATIIVARVRKLALGRLADVVAVACLVAMTIGRVACALVHDHPGIATDSVLGLDFPVWRLRAAGIPVDGPPLLHHDVGLEELLVLLPMTAAAFVLVRARLRPGTVAAIAALGYACVRFGLDFLRHPALEPSRAGLTIGQWCCLAMAAVAVVALRRAGQARS